ncbi:hypothetical protein CPC08DRAFT_269318 [Agrocybe pediades]|nr:hypothetical protein CPC08DRAFT_269318 [Agrocybe pediades]
MLAEIYLLFRLPFISSSPLSHTLRRKSTIVYPTYLKCVPTEQLATSTSSPTHSIQNHRCRRRVGACHQLSLLATTCVPGIERMIFVRAGGGDVRRRARGQRSKTPTQSSASRKLHHLPSMAGLTSFLRIGCKPWFSDDAKGASDGVDEERLGSPSRPGSVA